MSRNRNHDQSSPRARAKTRAMMRKAWRARREAKRARAAGHNFDAAQAEIRAAKLDPDGAPTLLPAPAI